MQALDLILNHYNHEGYLITLIHCDGEFCPIIGDVLEDIKNLDVNFAAPTNHVPDIN